LCAPFSESSRSNEGSWTRSKFGPDQRTLVCSRGLTGRDLSAARLEAKAVLVELIEATQGQKKPSASPTAREVPNDPRGLSIVGPLQKRRGNMLIQTILC